MVTTAMLGLCLIVSSWKEDSSSTTMSSGRISSTRHSSGLPMFPPTKVR